MLATPTAVRPTSTHVLHLLSGRNSEEKRTLTESLVEALKPHIVPGPALRVQITAEALDLDRSSYAKAVVNP